MAEYISREAACTVMPDDYYGWRDKQLLKSIPAADVREVVTCEHCKHSNYTGLSYLCDKHSGHKDVLGEDERYYEYHYRGWFCADGEKREVKHET